MRSSLEQLISDVKHNCEITNAKAKQDLDKFEVIYRIENSTPFWEDVPNSKLKKWHSEKRDLWKNLKNSSYVPITRTPSNLIYFAFGENGLQANFLAEKLKEESFDGCTILTAGKELAFDVLSDYLGYQKDSTIILRPERHLVDVRRMLTDLRSAYSDIKNMGPCNPDYVYALLESTLQENGIQISSKNELKYGIEKLSKFELEITRLHELGHFKKGWSGNLAKDQLAADVYALEKILQRKNETLLKLFIERVLNSYDYYEKPELEPLYSLYWKTLPDAMNWKTKINWDKMENARKKLKIN